MTVRIYLSTDVGAPTLNGTAGSIIAVLDACLVNGYGSRLPMGWTKEFSSPSVGVYRALVGTRYYLRVDDAATFVTANNCLVRAFETMSDVNTGTNTFPKVAQLTNGIQISKSSTIDATARGWCIVAHERSFYFLGTHASSAAFTWATMYVTVMNATSQFFFGEILSFKDSDIYNSFLFTNLQDSTGISNTTWGVVQTGHYGARNAEGTLVSHGTGKIFAHTAIPGSVIGSGISGETSNRFPELTTAEGGLGAIEVIEHAAVSGTPLQFRGRMPGLWGGNTGFTPNGHTVEAATQRQGPALAIEGRGLYAGRTYMPVILGYNGSSAVSVGWIELTDNWYSL